MLKKLFILAIIGFLCFSIRAETINSTVTKVYDGDTITLKGNIRIRLAEIDAPEMSQTYGLQSKNYLQSLIYGQPVKVEWSKKDRYRRIIGTVYLGETNVNLKMVSLGHAWHYKHYSSDKRLAEAEQKAKEAKLGLWGNNNVVAPWDYRRNGKSKQPSKGNETTTGQYWINK